MVVVTFGVFRWRRCLTLREDLSAAAAANAAQAALFVQTRLFALGSEEAAVSKIPQDAGTLHRGLEPLQQALLILSFT